jgi:two-component system sensor histidine kinase UhpB
MQAVDTETGAYCGPAPGAAAVQQDNAPVHKPPVGAGALSMPQAWALIGAAMLVLGAAMAGLPPFAVAPNLYLPLHNAMETFSIVILCLVFAVAWNAPQAGAGQTALACAFLGAALLTFLHISSHEHLAAAFAGNEADSSIRLRLAARVLVACGFLTAALMSNPVPLARRSRWAALAFMLAAVALLAVAEARWAAQLPRMFVPSAGLTPLKVGAEFVIFAVFAAATLITYLRRRAGAERPVLFAACAIAALGELCFAVYPSLFDVLLLLGHALQVLAFYLLYRSLFVMPLAAPFARIDALQSEARQSETRWREALEAGAHGMFDWDVAAGRVFRSDGYCRILGYKREELESVAPGMEDLMHPDDRARVHAAIDEVRGRADRYAIEARVRSQDGAYRWLAWRSMALRRDGDGRALRVVGTVTDITERKAVELRLQQATTSLRELMARERREIETERKRISQALHDDVGQYLVALRMEASRLADHLGQAEVQRQGLARISEQIDGAREALRRAIADLRPAALDEFGLRVAARRLVDRWSASQRIETEFSSAGAWDDVPERVQTELYRILVEALNNVAQHAACKSVHVALLRGADAVHLTVADDGCGLPADAQTRPGHYGLFGISERVTQLGGTLTLSGSAGLGTELAVTLPLAPP